MAPGTGTPVAPADAVLACPLTFNSVNKFAHGHADNFAVGLLCEMVGYRVPVVVVPHCKPQLASHPAFTASLQPLRGMGVRVLFDPDAPYERRQRTQQHGHVIALVAATLVLHRVHDYDCIHERRQRCSHGWIQVGEVLLSRAVQLPPVHASDAEPGPDLFPGHPLLSRRRPLAPVGVHTG